MLLWTEVPLINQLTFTVWLAVTLNVLVAPTLFVTGEAGEDAVIDGAPAAAAGVTVHVHICIAEPLAFWAIAVTFQLPWAALVLV